MRVSLIVACDLTGGIGFRGAIPWRLPSDLRRFKGLTIGHHIVMGRKTWESIGGPLPGRQSIIISHQKDYSPLGAITVNSLDLALELARQNGEQECFIIGGGMIYAEALPKAQRIYATLVQANIQADVFFKIPGPDAWCELENSFVALDGDEYRYYYKILERIDPPQR